MKLVLYNHISMRLCTVTSFCYKKNRKFDGVQLEQIIRLFKLVRKKRQFVYHNKRKPQPANEITEDFIVYTNGESQNYKLILDTI